MEANTISNRKRTEEFGGSADLASKKQKMMNPIGLDKCIPEAVIVSSILPKLIKGSGLIHTNRYMKTVILPRVKTLKNRITQDNRVDVLRNIANDIEYTKHITSVKVTLVGIFDACSWYPFFVDSFPSLHKLVIDLESLPRYTDKVMVDYCLGLWKSICAFQYPDLHSLSIKIPSEYAMEFDRINLGTKMAISLRKPDCILDAPQLKKLEFPFPQYIVCNSTQMDTIGGYWQSFSNHKSDTILTVNSTMKVRDFGAMPITINTSEISAMVKPTTTKILDHLIIKKIFRGDAILNITNTSTPVIPKLTIVLLLNIDLCLDRIGPASSTEATFATTETNLIIDYLKNGQKSDLLLKWGTFVNLILSSAMYKSINSDTIYTYATKNKQFVISKQTKRQTYRQIGQMEMDALKGMRRDPERYISTADPSFWDETVLAYAAFGCLLAHRALDDMMNFFGDYDSCDSITIEDSVDLQKFLLLVHTFLIDTRIDRSIEFGLPGSIFRCNSLHLNIRDEQKLYITPLVKLFHPRALFVNGWSHDLASIGIH